MDTRDALLTFAPGILLIALPILICVIFTFLTAGCIDIKVPGEFHHTHDVRVRTIYDTADTSIPLDDQAI